MASEQDVYVQIECGDGCTGLRNGEQAEKSGAGRCLCMYFVKAYSLGGREKAGEGGYYQMGNEFKKRRGQERGVGT